MSESVFDAYSFAKLVAVSYDEDHAVLTAVDGESDKHRVVVVTLTHDGARALQTAIDCARKQSKLYKSEQETAGRSRGDTMNNKEYMDAMQDAAVERTRLLAQGTIVVEPTRRNEVSDSKIMTFLEALKTGRPIRRRSSWPHAPQWLYLGDDGRIMNQRPCWRRIDTGELVGLSASDYLADDWTVMP